MTHAPSPKFWVPRFGEWLSITEKACAKCQAEKRRGGICMNPVIQLARDLFPLPGFMLAKIVINVDSGCWTWTGCKRGAMGYGNVRIMGKSQAAHRVAWELVNGPIPVGMKVLHRCDNPPCINYSHLFLGTDKDNQQDKAAKGRHWQQKKTHCPYGHEYTHENTVLPPSGGRKCLTCRRAKYKCNQQRKESQ